MPEKKLLALAYSVILLSLKVLSQEMDSLNDFDENIFTGNADGQQTRELFGANARPDISAPDHVVRFFRHLANHVDTLWENQNTARSLIPHLQGRGCDIGNFWSFDLMTSLPDKKDFIKCELHFFKKKTATSSDAPLIGEITLGLYDEDVSSCARCGNKSYAPCRQPVTKRTVSWLSRGWQIFDVTDFLNRTLTTGRDSPVVSVGMKLESLNENDVFAAHERARREDNSLRRHAHPFLVIYSNDSSVAATSLPLKIENSELLKAKPNRLEEPSSVSELGSEQGVGVSSKELYRHPRSVVVRSHPLLSNRYPESVAEVDETFPKFAERNHQERKAKKKARKNRKKFALADSEEFEPDEATDAWKNTHNTFNKCSRHAMKVDFRMIGWGEYVITPKSYEAYYCAGYCPYPLTRELRPSNHAAIQSLVNTLDPYQSIPPACCVPEKMSPLSIVYFEDENVVLKVYPKMSVDTCACQ